MSMEDTNDTIGIETATFGLLAQCPNELRHRVSLQFTYTAHMHNVVSYFKSKLYPIYCCSLLGIKHWT